jgi:hypothetical protein
MRIAMNGPGAAMLAWTEFIDGARELATHRFDGAAWGSEPDLPALGTVAPISAPGLGIDGDGRAVLLSCRVPDAHVAAIAHDGSAWGPPEDLSHQPDGGVGSCHDVTVAVADSGHVLAIWSWEVAAPAVWILGAWYDPIAGTWSPDERISLSSARQQSSPRSAINDAGVGEGTFTFDDSGWRAVGARRLSGGALATTTMVFEFFGNAEQPAPVALDACGNAIAIWLSNDRPMAGRSDPDGVWPGASPIAADPTVLANTGAMALSMNAAGRTVAVWRRGTGIAASRFVTGCGAL